MARIRSPNYPQMGLSDAISRTAQVFQKERQHPAPKDVVVRHLGYSSLNGASLGALSALLKYGLLDREGENYRVSDRAIAILAPHNPQEKIESVQAAAKSPALFAEILDSFKGVLPSDENLRAYLIRRGFAESAIGPVISTLRDTVQFVADTGGTAHTANIVQPQVQKTMTGQAAAQPVTGNPGHFPIGEALVGPRPTGLRVSLTENGLEVSAGIVDQTGIDRLIFILEANKLLLPAGVEPKASLSGDGKKSDQDGDEVDP
jgi:hypothetical protein